MTTEHKDDGGPAFPSHTKHVTLSNPDKPYNGDSTSPDWNPNLEYYPDGMSLRDYFAAKALTALANQYGSEDAAKWAYQMADSMLKERNK